MKTVMDHSVGVIGTGDFAQSVTKRLMTSGYDVIMGSRRPDARKLSMSDRCACTVNVTSVEECIRRTSIIFMAIHYENYKDCVGEYVTMFRGKIVVDVSNGTKSNVKGLSNAERLGMILPDAIIVKAFNVVSAYAMENDCAGGSKQVYVASNDRNAKDQICVIARDMGFCPVDLGLLSASKKIETFQTKLFPLWRGPFAFTIGVFNIWMLYVIFLYFIRRTPAAYRWDQLFVKVLNKPLCMTAITILACTYLPSSVAAIFQIYYGTKHKIFPNWLDRWLKARKQLGIIAFVLVIFHVIFSITIMSPTYYRSWFQSTTITIPGNLTEDIKIPIRTWMIWKAEAAILVGAIAFVCLCVIFTTTLPSVTNTLNWREWRCIQSKLGHVTLFLCVLHAAIMGMPGWVKYSPAKLFMSITFLSSLLPYLTLLLRLTLTLPCLSRYVRKIRHGWEARYAVCKAKCAASPGHVIHVNGDDSSKSSDECSMMILENYEDCKCARTSVV